MKLAGSVCGVIASLAIVCLAAGQDRGPAQKEIEKLQGTWKVVKSALLDEGPRKYFEERGKVVVSGNRVTFLVDDPKGQAQKFVEFIVRVDSSTSPKTFDLTIDSIADPKADEKGKRILGIYSLHGDTLKFHMGDIDKDRPKEFPKSGEGVVELKREKP